MRKTTYAIVVLFCALSVGVFPALAATTALDSGVTASNSLNWSGYSANGGQYTSASGTWTVPTVTAATAPSGDATWVGIGGLTGSDLIQSGTQAIVSSAGVVSYVSWYEMLPNASVDLPVAVKAGDSVTVTLAETSANLWQITFRDNTTGGNASIAVNYDSSLSSAEWIEEMPMVNDSFIPLDSFGTTSFTAGYAVKNGSFTNISGTGATPVTMVTANGQILATPSSLGSDGASFSVTRSSVVSTASSATGSAVSPPYIVGRGTRTGVGMRRDPNQTTSVSVPIRSLPRPSYSPHRFVRRFSISIR